MDKYDTSHLTEFPRFEQQSAQSGVSTFLTKLWRFPLFSNNEGNDGSQSGRSNVPHQGNSAEARQQDFEDIKTDAGTYAVEIEGRSLPNVLKRISSLVALSSGGGTRYADTELARYWMPDDISRECYECATRFSALRRRHHCRVCGQIFCNRCCSQRVPGQIFGCAGGLRVCTYCCKVVLSYLRENELAGDMSPDLRTLQENLQVKFPENQSVQSTSKDNFMFSDEHLEPNELRSSPKEALQDIFRQLSFTLPTQQHRYRLVRYNGVWRGCDVLQWVMDHTNNKTRAQASIVCQNLLHEGFMECVTEMPKFADYALYKPMVIPPITNQDESPAECNRLVESVSSYCLDLNLGDSSARLTKSPKTENKSPSSEEDSPIIQQGETTPENKNTCKAITECGEDHLKLLLGQCLSREGLQASWSTVIYPLCQQAAQIISLDTNSNDIDIRNYVQIKKVAGGNIKDSSVVEGVVLTKNVAHRAMPQRLTNPSVLLLDCSIAYQRVEGKLTSLEPLLLQEQEYLVRCAARIAALKPKVVLVKGTAARTVQDALRKDGVALATGVGERALRRLSRCTGADIVTSVDARVALPRLGTCSHFYVNNYSGKTLMFLEDCSEPHLGCCILLRGPSLQELKRVKKVVKFMLLACYNWRLEHTFLNDIEAILPEPGMTFDDDLDQGHDDEDDIKPDSNIECGDDNDMTVKGDVSIDEIMKDINKKMAENVDDPLQSANKSYPVKVDSDKTLSCGVPIQDFSDPLRAKQVSIEDDVFFPKEAKLKTDTNTVRWSTDDAVLSMSPNVIINAPFLETEAGRKCPLRQYYHDPLFPVRANTITPNAVRRKISRHADSADVLCGDMHPFIKNPITKSADDPALKASLAHYRAVGAQTTKLHTPNCPQYKKSVIKVTPKKEPELEHTEKTQEPCDPLAPENHQRLSLLLYSYCNKSSNVPDFCVNPWIVTMDMYGRQDISLGAFLEKYCFNGDYKCPSSNCQVPMNQHMRRFVHGDVCITITCNTIGHSTVDKINQEPSNQIMFWSRCSRCGCAGRAARLSRGACSLSLCKYLELRARGGRYLRDRHCRHPLMRHNHYFHRALTTACFKFTKITSWDIELPPEVIATQYDTKSMRDYLITQVNELLLKGHETFSSVSEPESDKDHANFKQQMEQIHLALTSSTLHEQTTSAGVVQWLWSVNDRIVLAEKLLRDAQDRLAPTAKTVRLHSDNTAEEKSEGEENGADSTSNELGEYLQKADTDHQGTEEDEEKGDKKTVRQILSQLLSNNQPSNQNGMIIVGGVIPVVVFAGEIGSVIAATLASVQYQRQLQSLLVQSQAQPSQSEVDDAEITNSTKDKTDSDKTKSMRSNEHIEVLLKDGLLCRVYYAAQFHKLRSMLLAPLNSNCYIADEFCGNTDALTEGPPDKDVKLDDCKDKNENKRWCSERQTEEGFVRSLSCCEQWAARGGKSGSTFCKTKDDRFVLKEMTKPEWQQFLEFAPHYFNYVINCHQNKLPTLLARIVGVFSVGGAGNGVLVMENLLYGQPRLARTFDLKGASRHRLTPDTQPTAVLMDENMLHMRWEQPLYVQAHTAGVLSAAVERDTAFLVDNSVMDYSLLLGLTDNTLVLGIIDYIRTFTWDKKLEHYVKKNLGSGQPTVVSPEQYKERFRNAMNKYFLHCPDQWENLHKGLAQ